jgi:hypothetical protein
MIGGAVQSSDDVVLGVYEVPDGEEGSMLIAKDAVAQAEYDDLLADGDEWELVATWDKDTTAEEWDSMLGDAAREDAARAFSDGVQEAMDELMAPIAEVLHRAMANAGAAVEAVGDCEISDDARSALDEALDEIDRVVELLESQFPVPGVEVVPDAEER